MMSYLEMERLLEEMIEEKKYADVLEYVDIMMKETSDRKMLALLLYERGKAQYFSGDYRGAMESIEKAHSLIDDMEDSEFKYGILFHIAAMYTVTGDFDSAESMYHVILEKLPEENHFHLSALHNLGEMQKKRGDMEGAMKYLKECYEKSVKYGDNFLAAYSAENLAEIYAGMEDKEESIKWLETALPLSRKAGDSRLVPMIELTLKMLNGEDPDKVLERAEEIKKMGADHAHDMADMFYTFSNLLPDERARIYLKEAVLIYSETGDGYMEKKSIEKLEEMR